MAVVFLYWVTLWMALLGTAHSCPRSCVCQETLNHHLVNCANKDLLMVPAELPSNITTLNLSANKITALKSQSFESVTHVISLWFAHNTIATVEAGTLAPLVHMRNLDLSYNKLVNFPWMDLKNLTALHFLKMDNNEMVSLPKDAFSALKDLRSLRINNNKFTTLVEGTFSPLILMSHLQIHNNPFICSCTLEWLRDWLLGVEMFIPEQNYITCEAPAELKGGLVVRMPILNCLAPTVHVSSQPDIYNMKIYEGFMFILNCDAKGHPTPEVMWKICVGNQYFEFNIPSTVDEKNDLPMDEEPAGRRFVMLQNGTLIVPYISTNDEGNYSCLAVNDMGQAESTIEVVVAGIQRHDIKSVPDTTAEKVHPWVHWSGPETSENSVINSDKGKYKNLPSRSTYITLNSKHDSREPLVGMKCGVHDGTQYISNHAFNQSLPELKQYAFDFGVISLEVSDTEAKIQLNPLRLSKVSLQQSQPQEHRTVNKDLFNLFPEGSFDLLYLCVNNGKGQTVVQWSKIEDGINAYHFMDLLPGTNYTLCLTYDKENCQVQVVFVTRKKTPSLLIIVVVSIFLLSLATVPLLGATFCHLMQKYQGKTYKLIIKAHNPNQMKHTASDLNHRVSFVESEKDSSITNLGKEDSVTDIAEGEWEGNGITEPIPTSHSDTKREEFEVSSEYSDRLPLGAEAVNMSGEINGNYKQQVL